MAGIRESNENVIRRRLACVWLTYQGYSLVAYLPRVLTKRTITDHFCIVYDVSMSWTALGSTWELGPCGDTDSKVEPGTTLPPFDPRGEAFRKSKIYTLTVPYSHTLPLSPHSMYVLGGEAACAG